MHKTKTESYVAETEGHVLHGSAGFYDKLVGLISLGREKRIRSATLDLIDIQAGTRILDVGCGTGNLTIAAKRRQGEEGFVAGIDPSSNMVDQAKRKAVKAGVEVDFKVGVVEKIEYPDEHFDFVLSSLMMHHLPDDLKIEAMMEVQRALKPGGVFLIVDFDPGALYLISLIHGPPSITPETILDREEARYLRDCGYRSIDGGSLNILGLAYLKASKVQS